MRAAPSLLLVGEDYGRGEPDPTRALAGRAGHRLAELAGVPVSTYLARTVRVNVVDRPDDWLDPDVVSRGLGRVFGVASRHRRTRVILLGRRVATAFGLDHLPLFAWSGDVARSPHPSGRNRFWNDADAVREARAFWHEAFATPLDE